MEGFRYLPFVFFVAYHGTDHFEDAMAAQYELTKRFTAEFSVRAYIERYPDKTLARLRIWAHDDNVHVRRLVSEGTRPRLPWAPQLRRFREDPMPVLELLELLKDDEEEYVRRSVANNLNDIAKDHPDLVVATATEWWNGDDNRRRLVRHGLRTLIKQGDPGALAILGYGKDSPTRIDGVAVTPEVVSIGESVRITIELVNPSDQPSEALVDIVVHFVKANGSTSPKVFKGGERSLSPGGSATVSKLISVAQFSTRTHYPGTHIVEIQINGQREPGGSFEIRG
jgi:3-methyladenine DNA glycosylase AlkC